MQFGVVYYTFGGAAKQMRACEMKGRDSSRTDTSFGPQVFGFVISRQKGKEGSEKEFIKKRRKKKFYFVMF